MMQLNPTVGVAPGTTTMTLGDPGDCPPDEPWQYVNPPDVIVGPPSGVSPDVTQYPTPQYWNPYQDPPSLKGARGLGDFVADLGNANWAVVLFFGAAAFAIALGVFYFRGRKKA